MNSSSAPKWLVLIVPLLLLSIAWKIATPINDYNGLPKNALIDFFERAHFLVTEQNVYGVPMIEAKADSCQLQVASLAPDGSNRNFVQHLFEGKDRSFVVFHGRVYIEQPVLWTAIDNIWSMCLRNLGLINHVAPVIAVAANASCDAERLPWDDLRYDEVR